MPTLELHKLFVAEGIIQIHYEGGLVSSCLCNAVLQVWLGSILQLCYMYEVLQGSADHYSGLKYSTVQSLQYYRAEHTSIVIHSTVECIAVDSVSAAGLSHNVTTAWQNVPGPYCAVLHTGFCH